MDLFDHTCVDEDTRHRPLAARMRPRTLEEILGQEQFGGRQVDLIDDALGFRDLVDLIRLSLTQGRGCFHLERFLNESRHVHRHAFNRVQLLHREAILISLKKLRGERAFQCPQDLSPRLVINTGQRPDRQKNEPQKKTPHVR